ncbi:myotubularin-related protein 10 [Hyla sarda]|uniref:myotubularin-related protein 10 n=1 Tax=Hyla sarda TaxID=327740 RepID=UPI0024C2981D|nr:myotubularin-related protein 10 [Hyla sarda]
MFSVKQQKPSFRSYLLPPQHEDKLSPETKIKKLKPVLLPDWLIGIIEQIVVVNDTKRKQKILSSNKKLKFNPTELIIYCKDFRILRFRFDESGPESAKKVCLALAHYSQPTDLQLLFAFEYVAKMYNNQGDRINGIDPGGGDTGPKTPLYETYSDWDREIKRTGASEWRVCSVNEGYMISKSLPEYFVVPSSLADTDLKQYSYSFFGRRMPLWCWNHSNGSALVRMSYIKDLLQQRKIDQRICGGITRSHPLRSDVYKCDLDHGLPTLQDIQTAFSKLKQLSVNELFDETEDRWLSSLESTRWLEYVRTILKQAIDLVYVMDSKRLSVVIQEEEGRDLSCLVASLVQLMLDPYFRTIVGFQSLIQKEWVMAGYPFLDRCNHLRKSEKECPLFVLFLDCVWQLLEQYPAAFQFTETYLTVLQDSTCISLFGTFLFNCPHQRVQQSTEFAIGKNIQLGDEKGLKFPSVWNWSLQFSLKDRALFNNPLYIGKSVPSVQNGITKSFKRTKKNYSSTLRGIPPSLKNGIIPQPELMPRRNSLILRLRPELVHQAPEIQNNGLQQYLSNFFSKPVDLHGVILPRLNGPYIKLWKLLYLRWIPEAQINHGGSITAFHKISLLADEIEMLQTSLRQYRSFPLSQATSPESEQSRMFFRADDLQSSYESLDFLSSSFPFSPVGNLCRRSILGTPISKFLNGAKIWLSTETLANED